MTAAKMKVKIGIDVGGTFTHAVAVDMKDYSILDKACVPTTHKAAEGVAAGVVQSMQRLLKGGSFDSSSVIMIAHSTTQATNALLEGDVAPVGVLLLGRGLEGRIGRKQLEKDEIRLSENKVLPVSYAYLDTDKDFSDRAIRNALQLLADRDAEVMVASEVFGVDHPENEERVRKIASEMGYLASSASGISKLYGLRVRTRTAVINASMMPKMLATANMTEQAVKDSGLNVPLMIMRSDGGIMDIAEMRKRPILTMLSGPAAGVAAALMYVKISDGIFLEVGGTSTDISVIKNGKPQVRSAQIGGNRLFLRTLDVRTLGIAGGSVPRIRDKKIIEVGPRSAHIADLSYVSFAEDDDFSSIHVSTTRPREDDPDDYLVLKRSAHPEDAYTLTPTACSEFLGLHHSEGHGSPNSGAVRSAITALAHLWKTEPARLAEQILERSAAKVKPVIRQLIREYKLEASLVTFIGGGGGAAAIVPFAANYMGFTHRIAENSEVISAIGAALGIIQDSVERSVTQPNESDIQAIRREALASVLQMGADPATVEVRVEFDNREKKLIATAGGNTELRTRDLDITHYTETNILPFAATLLGLKSTDLELVAALQRFFVILEEKKSAGLKALFKRRRSLIRVFDSEGVIRLQIPDAHLGQTTVSGVRQTVKKLISELTSYGDAGALLPNLYLLAGSRVLDLTGMMNESQLMALLDIELNELPEDEAAVLIASAKN